MSGTGTLFFTIKSAFLDRFAPYHYINVGMQVLARGLKNAESQTRTETMVTFGKVCKGMGGAAYNVHKDIYKVSTNHFYFFQNLYIIQLKRIVLYRGFAAGIGLPKYIGRFFASFLFIPFHLLVSICFFLVFSIPFVF